eukprot:12930736-Prorocentrum_lima.AAC.1
MPPFTASLNISSLHLPLPLTPSHSSLGSLGSPQTPGFSSSSTSTCASSMTQPDFVLGASASVLAGVLLPGPSVSLPLQLN